MEVDQVKKSESGMIIDPVTITPEQQVREVLKADGTLPDLGRPVTGGISLWGSSPTATCVSKPIWTKDFRGDDQGNLVTVSEGIPGGIQEAAAQAPDRKAPGGGPEGRLTGMITIKDIEKIKKYPNACKDAMGRLRVGAAVGVGPDMDGARPGPARPGRMSSDRHLPRAFQKRDRRGQAAQKHFKDIELVAGNVATAKGAEALIKAGVDASKSASAPVPSAPPASWPASGCPRSRPS
jgi:IMP dehydrogenase